MKGVELKPNVYIDLDSLLDTRLGTLRVMDDIEAMKLISFEYRHRDVDEFDGFNTFKFKELYENRTVLTLQKSVVTNITFVLIDIFLEIMKTPEYLTVSGFKPRLDINLYPYILSDDEKKELITIMKLEFSGRCDINLIYYPLENLKPNYVGSQYSHFISYDWHKWIYEHSGFNKGGEEGSLGEFKLFGLTGLCILAPTIYTNGKPKDEDLMEDGKIIDPFNQLECGSQALYKLNFIDTFYFSIFDPTYEHVLAHAYRQ